MADQLLVNVVTVTLAASATTIIPHGLKVEGRGVVPTQVIADGPTTIGVLNVNTLGVEFINLGPNLAIAKFRIEYDHSIHAIDTPTVAWGGWNGTAQPIGPASGDLAGTYPAPTVVGLEGYPIEDGAPANGDAILFNSAINKWQHAPITFSGGPPTGPASRDLGGNYPDPLVVGLQNSPLAPTVADGFIKRNAANTAWEGVAYGSAANTVTQGNDPRLSDARTPTGTASGDLSGTYPSPVVDGLQNRPVAATAPVTDDVLAWNGTAWTPVAINSLIENFPGGYGSYSDATDQTIPTIPNVLSIKYGQVELEGAGITLANDGLGRPTRLTVTLSGIYSFAISAQLVHTGGTDTVVSFWAKRNGIDVPRSASSLEMGNNNRRTVPYIELEIDMNAGEYIEWFFTQTGTNNTKLAQFPVTGPVPAIPSVIVNIKRIGAAPIP